MKVIKHGDRVPRQIRTECSGCGCEFEFGRDEAKLIDDPRDGDFYSISCPDCNRLCTIDYKLTV